MKMKCLLLAIITAIVLAVFMGGCTEDPDPNNNGNTSKIWDGTVDVSWYDESKTEFTITTAEQLAGLATLSENNDFSGITIKLDADIMLNDTKNWKNWEYWVNQGQTYEEVINFKPIMPANRWFSIKSFNGTFSGNSKKIIGLYGSCFINEVKGKGAVKNLKIMDSYISRDCPTGSNICVGYGVGSFASTIQRGSIISNCSSNANIGASGTTGGIVARNDEGQVRDCVYEGDIYVKRGCNECIIGGLVGLFYKQVGSGYENGCVIGNASGNIIVYGDERENCSTPMSLKNNGIVGAKEGQYADYGDGKFTGEIIKK
jgi:hypothetical protein